MGKFEVVPLAVYGTNAIGVYVFANNEYALIPQDAPQRLIQGVRDALSVEVIQVSIAKSPLVGIFVAGNDNGIILPSIVTDDELQRIRLGTRKDLNVEVVPSKYTAISNLVLTNNKVSLISNIMETELLHNISNTLGTEAVSGDLCGSYIVGSIAIINDNGVLMTPDASDEDVKKVKDLFKIRVNVGTINRGIGFVRSGAVANNRGAIVGSSTTGFEIMRLIETLG